jgi:hypothetical protein
VKYIVDKGTVLHRKFVHDNETLSDCFLQLLLHNPPGKFVYPTKDLTSLEVTLAKLHSIYQLNKIPNWMRYITIADIAYLPALSDTIYCGYLYRDIGYKKRIVDNFVWETIPYCAA